MKRTRPSEIERRYFKLSTETDSDGKEVVGHIPVPCNKKTFWLWKEFHMFDCLVQEDQIGDDWVSTVFRGGCWDDLGWPVDLNPPPLFWTQVRKTRPRVRNEASFVTTSTTWELALEQHHRVFAALQAGRPL
jgi:hypothetical protein